MGVLRVLDELRIPIDCVVGTSMGALVGATFAAGTPPAEVEREMLAIKWEETVGGQGRRNRMPISRKLANITYTNSLELGVAKGRLLTPGGLINTQQIEQVATHARRTRAVRARLRRSRDSVSGNRNGHGEERDGGARAG